jgi:hypothetical protein
MPPAEIAGGIVFAAGGGGDASAYLHAIAKLPCRHAKDSRLAGIFYSIVRSFRF